MKKVVRLTESDLTRIVKRVINEGGEAEHIMTTMDDFLKEYKGRKGTWEIINDGYISIQVQDPNDPKIVYSLSLSK